MKTVLFVAGLVGNVTAETARALFSELKPLTDARLFVFDEDSFAVRFDRANEAAVKDVLKKHNLSSSPKDPEGEIMIEDLPFDSN